MNTISYKTLLSLVGCSEQITLNKLPGIISTYCFSPDGQTLLLGDSKEEVWRWNRVSKTLEYFATPFPGSAVTSMAFTPDGRHVAFGSHNSHTLLIVNNRTGEEKAVHDIPPSCKQILFHPDGHLVAVLASGTVGLLETYSGCLYHKEDNVDLIGIEAHNGDPVIGMLWLQRTSYLLTCTSTGVLRCFDAFSGDLISQVDLKRGIQTMQPNEDGALALLTSQDRALVVDASSMRTISSVYGIKPKGVFTTGFADAGFRVGYIQEATNLLYTYSTKECFMFPEEQKPEREFNIEELSKGTVKANSVLFSPKGDYCLCFDRVNLNREEANWLLIHL